MAGYSSYPTGYQQGAVKVLQRGTYIGFLEAAETVVEGAFVKMDPTTNKLIPTAAVADGAVAIGVAILDQAGKPYESNKSGNVTVMSGVGSVFVTNYLKSGETFTVGANVAAGADGKLEAAGANPAVGTVLAVDGASITVKLKI